MAKKDDAEEAIFDPTDKRLRRLRDDGQVARSQDFTGAVTLIAVLIYLFLAKDNIVAKLRLTFEDAPIFAPIDFWDRVTATASMMGQITAELTLPVIIITIMSAIFATILDVKGFIFSLKPLTPNFAKFNPAEGLKNMFKMKNLLELFKSLFKMLILFVCVYYVVRRHMNSVFWSPTCGLPCVMDVALIMIMWVVIIGSVILIVGAGVDLLLSRWLFKKDNKMTLTEMKREQKEDYGDPHVRSARKQERNRLAQGAGLTGPNAANLWIRGREGVVGIAYKPDISGVPIVSAKGKDDAAREFTLMARNKNIAVIDDPELVTKLITIGRVGEPIPRDTFTDVARALVQAGFTG